MALALLFTLLALLVIGSAAGVAYAGIAAGATASAVALGSFAVFALLVPFLFVLLIFGLMRSGFCPARGLSPRHDGRGPRMSDEWHRTAHERGVAGKGES